MEIITTLSELTGSEKQIAWAELDLAQAFLESGEAR